MSLILKGIDLPSKPTQIKIYPNEIIFCANEDGINIPKAQAIQIPKDHGRIGDLDGVIKQIDKSPTFASKYKGTARLFIDVYSDSNTILDKERE